ATQVRPARRAARSAAVSLSFRLELRRLEPRRQHAQRTRPDRELRAAPAQTRRPPLAVLSARPLSSRRAAGAPCTRGSTLDQPYAGRRAGARGRLLPEAPRRVHTPMTR